MFPFSLSRQLYHRSAKNDWNMSVRTTKRSNYTIKFEPFHDNENDLIFSFNSLNETLKVDKEEKVKSSIPNIMCIFLK